MNSLRRKNLSRCGIRPKPIACQYLNNPQETDIIGGKQGKQRKNEEKNKPRTEEQQHQKILSPDTKEITIEIEDRRMNQNEIMRIQKNTSHNEMEN